MKFEIFKFENVTSTNDVAINLIKGKQKEIGCVYTDTQTKGRGTHGRKWISDKGNLFSSIFFPLEDNYPPFNEFSIISPVIISDVIRHFCDKKNVNLKFPNDVFVNKKEIKIIKNIPQEAGMGGGSINAASLLNFFNETFTSGTNCLFKKKRHNRFTI